MQSQRQKRRRTSKKEIGIVKSEEARGLILERKIMMMVVGRQPYAPAVFTPRGILVLIFRR